jgi:enediyne biosynthesis protein E4
VKDALLALFVDVAIFGGACSGGPSGGVTGPQKPQTTIRFDDATVRSGIRFQHVPTRTDQKFMPEILGSGVGIADFNRDGAPDVLLVNSGAIGAATRPENAKDRLYINDGRGHFTDKTDEWSLTSAGYGMGVAVGDFDNDGWTDVFLTSYDGNNRLLRNTGAHFEDVTAQSGIRPDGKWATSAGFLDIDNDGDLDLYVVRYVDYTNENAQQTYHNRLLIYSTPILYNAVPDQIWRNDGGGRFTEIGATAGIASARGKGLALAIGDIDGDGDEDVFVANDTSSNQLWLNDGRGRFKDGAQLSGAAYSEVGKEQANMGADFSDFDGNGLLDIAVATFQTEATAIYRQREPMLFEDVTDAVGVGASSRARLKFGIDWFDADNDGDEDLMVANGHLNIEQDSDSVTFAQQNSLYENLGGSFADISDVAGNALLDKQVSRGLATADLNGDGALDFIVTNNGGTAEIGLNTTAGRGHFVILWLDGDRSNRSAIGARVVARIGDKKIERQVMGAQSYLSVSDFRLHFGLGPADKIDESTIYWPGAAPQTIKDLAGGKFYYVRQGKEPVPFIPGEKQIR